MTTRRRWHAGAIGAWLLAGCHGGGHIRAAAPRGHDADVAAETGGTPESPPPPVPTTVRDGGTLWLDVAPGITVRQVLTREEAHDGEWMVVRLDLARVALDVMDTERFDLHEVMAARRVEVAINGGYFEPDFRPSGLVLVDGIHHARYAPHGGSGVLLVRNHRAEVIPAEDAPLPPGPPVELALQCGPRLVEVGGTVGVHRDDGARFARSAACVRDGGATLDLIATWRTDEPLRGPGLMAFSQALAAPSPVDDPHGCDVALNLDGGPSTALFVRTAPGPMVHEPVEPVPRFLVVRTRP